MSCDQSIKVIELKSNWNIDPIDRAWFISSTRELFGDLSHRLIFKNKFRAEWDYLDRNGKLYGEIEEVVTNKLINSHYIKISELDDFYIVVFKLYDKTKEAIQGFCKSILKVRDINDSVITIHQLYNNETIKSTIGKTF